MQSALMHALASQAISGKWQACRSLLDNMGTSLMHYMKGIETQEIAGRMNQVPSTMVYAVR